MFPLSEFIAKAVAELRRDYPDAYADRHADGGLWADQEQMTREQAAAEWWRSLEDRAHYGHDVADCEWRSAIAARRAVALRLREHWRTVRREQAARGVL